MIGKTHIFWFVLAGTASGILFHTSYRVQELEEDLARLNREIIQEQEATQVLKAEWSYLNDPARLEALAQKYTVLGPTEAVQLAAGFDALPARSEAGPLLASVSPLPGRKPGAVVPASSRPNRAPAVTVAPAIMDEETTNPLDTASADAPTGQVAAVPGTAADQSGNGVVFATLGARR